MVTLSVSFFASAQPSNKHQLNASIRKCLQKITRSNEKQADSNEKSTEIALLLVSNQETDYFTTAHTTREARRNKYGKTTKLYPVQRIKFQVNEKKKPSENYKIEERERRSEEKS